MAKQNLRGKVFLITGATSGIGQAAALALGAQGGRLALGARRAEALEDVAREVRSRGGEALAIQTDVTDRSQVEHLVQETLAAWGRIDVLISNAGQYIRAAVLEMTLPDLQRSMAVNFYGHVHAVQAVLPAMLQQGSGHIILISTMDAKKGVPPDAPYVSAKYALSGFGEVLRQEMRPRGIAVTTLFPGRVDTPMIADLQVPRISSKIPPEAVAQAIVSAIRNQPAEMLLPPTAHLLHLANFLSPRLADWFVRVLKLEGWKI